MNVLKLFSVVALILLLTNPTGWGQSDVFDAPPATVGLAGNEAGQRLDPDERFALSAVLEHIEAQNEAALVALLRDDPSLYALTRGLLLSVLSDLESLSADALSFLRDYAFELGLPDEDLSGPELTALLNAPLSQSELQQLSSWTRLLAEPELVGGGVAVEQRQIDFLSTRLELRDQPNLTVRDELSFLQPLENALFISAERKVSFWRSWYNLSLSASQTEREGASQLLTLVALDKRVNSAVKRELMRIELGVPVDEGFNASQYGSIYVVLKAAPDNLRNTLSRIQTLDTFNPSAANDPDSTVAGQYSGRRIGLRVSLSDNGMASVLEHEIGHLAWDALLSFAQQSAYRQLFNQSQAGRIDFVTNYAQTNVLEDFAETFEAYMNDTVGWLERSETSDILRQKMVFVAATLTPYVYETNAGLGGVQVRRALVPFRNGLPVLDSPIAWQAL